MVQKPKNAEVFGLEAVLCQDIACHHVPTRLDHPKSAYWWCTGNMIYCIDSLGGLDFGLELEE